MEWRLEVVIVPVSDVDRAKAFYEEQLGFHLDVDHRAGDFRVVQLTPHGSACSVTLMHRDAPGPGSVKGLQLVVADIVAARAELMERGAQVGELFHFAEGSQLPGPDPQRANHATFFSFDDPDHNSWVVQEAGLTPR